MHRLSVRASLRKLEVFCVVAELRSVSRAADFLCVSQPVITSHIQSLEDGLGAKLTRREGRHIALTAEGIKVFGWAQNIVRRTLELERDIGAGAQSETGRVVVSASMSVGTYQLPGLICDFQVEHPHGRIELSISNPKIALEDTLTGGCDLAIVILSPEQSLDGLVARALWNDTLLLVSAPHSKWVGRSVTREQVSELPFISTTSGLVMKQLEQSLLRTHGIASSNMVVALGHPQAQKIAVQRDLGVCLFFGSAIEDELAQGTLRPVEIQGVDIAVPIYLVHRRDKGFSAFQSRFKEYIESRARQR